MKSFATAGIIAGTMLAVMPAHARQAEIYHHFMIDRGREILFEGGPSGPFSVRRPQDTYCTSVSFSALDDLLLQADDRVLLLTYKCLGRNILVCVDTVNVFPSEFDPELCAEVRMVK